MKPSHLRPSKSLVFAVLLSVVAASTGCDNGGGPKSVRRYFGSHHFGECRAIDIRVELDSPEFTIVRNQDGTFDCAPTAALVAAGCDIEIDVDETGGASFLHVAISGCLIDEEESFFDCAVVGEDRSLVEAATEATCDCEDETVCELNGSRCDTRPHVCVNTIESPFCELCSNEADDDGNGEIDCDDDNCMFTRDCGFHRGSSTVTCSSTTTTTPTTSSMEPTSTTLPVESIAVEFHLESVTQIGALQFTVDYAAAPGEFLGTGGSTECTSRVSGNLLATNDVDAERKLTFGIISLSGFTGPVALVECSFAADAEPTAAQFVITVDEATDASGAVVVPTIGVVVAP
jgi:hypothetical protein